MIMMSLVFVTAARSHPLPTKYAKLTHGKDNKSPAPVPLPRELVLSVDVRIDVHEECSADIHEKHLHSRAAIDVLKFPIHRIEGHQYVTDIDVFRVPDYRLPHAVTGAERDLLSIASIRPTTTEPVQYEMSYHMENAGMRHSKTCIGMSTRQYGKRNILRWRIGGWHSTAEEVSVTFVSHRRNSTLKYLGDASFEQVNSSTIIVRRATVADIMDEYLEEVGAADCPAHLECYLTRWSWKATCMLVVFIAFPVSIMLQTLIAELRHMLLKPITLMDHR